MIVDVDDSLQEMLADELSRTPGCPVYSREQITFDRPNDAAALRDGEARVNAYLCAMVENPEFRDESYQRTRKANGVGDAALRRGPVRINLQYMVTAHCGGLPQLEHRLLSDVLGVLFRYAAIPNAYLRGTLEGLGSNAVLIRTAQRDDTEQMKTGELWQAFGAKPQPSITVFVVAPYNPFETKWTKVVRQAIVAFGLGAAPYGPEKPLKTIPLSLSAAGIVLDRDTERPVAGARVEAASEMQGASTDDRGVFTMVNLPMGTIDLSISATGYETAVVAAKIPSVDHADLLEPMIVPLRRIKKWTLE